MARLQVVERDGKLEIVDSTGNFVHYIATRINRECVKVATLQEAEQFGGKIYMISNRVHKAGTSEEEVLPVSTFVKEVPENG